MRRPAGPKKCRSPPQISPPPRRRRRIPDARLPSHPSISDRGVPRALRVSTLPKMTSNPPDELDELIGFLADKRADARAHERALAGFYWVCQSLGSKPLASPHLSMTRRYAAPRASMLFPAIAGSHGGCISHLSKVFFNLVA